MAARIAPTGLVQFIDAAAGRYPEKVLSTPITEETMVSATARNSAEGEDKPRLLNAAHRTLEGGHVGCAITRLNISFCKDEMSSGAGGWGGVAVGTGSV